MIFRGYAKISCIILLAALYPLQKLVQAEPGLFQNMRERGTLHGAMRGHRDLECFGEDMFLEPNVATLLSDNNPAVAL